MALSEPQMNDISEDQEANELYNTFMDITKDAANMDQQPNNSTEIERDKQQSNVDGTVEEKENATMQTKESEEKTVETKNENEQDLPEEAKGNVSKSLSKAVNELSDLEKQLSLMISEGPKHSINQDNVSSTSYTVVNDDSTAIRASEEVGVIISVNEDESHDAEASALKSTESKGKETTWANEDADRNLNTEDIEGFKGDNEKETSEQESHTNVDEAKGVDAKGKEISPSSNKNDLIVSESVHEEDASKSQPSKGSIEVSAKSNEDVMKETGSESVHEEDALKQPSKESTEVSAKSNEDGMKETDSESVHEEYASKQPSMERTEVSAKSNEDGMKETDSESVPEEDAPKPQPIDEGKSNDVNVEEKVDENVESGRLANKDTPADQEASEQNDFHQENKSVKKPDATEQEDIKQDEAVDGKADDTIEEGSKESSPEVKDDNANRKSSSAADIEIVMTDESGISERKSLDSLDSLDDNNQGRPDSPALSDEGIDSDSKSDIGDDDTFDSMSSDFSVKSKSNSLEVDRNRTGSDSSTLSEQEFKSHLSDKTDGVNGEAADHISMQGYLLKLGGSGLTPRNWRRRWFVLKGDNCLYYYKHAKDKVPCGVIVLCNYSITKAPEYNRKCCFKLNKGGARSYHLCATNDDEMREWMVALMAAASEVAPDGSSFQISEGNVHNVSIPALSIKDPECHGYLSKQGHNIKNWKRRYCVLKNGYLYYYSDMSNTTALGVAKLLGYSIKMGDKRGKHYCFYGNPPDESLRTYHFSAETENDRDRWMTRMAESIHKGNMS